MCYSVCGSTTIGATGLHQKESEVPFVFLFSIDRFDLL